MRPYISATALVSIVACGCGAPGPRGMDSRRTALEQAVAAYHEAATTKDRDAVVALYGSDAMMIPPNAARLDGTDAVQGYRFGFIENPTVETRFETVSVEVSDSGDLGWSLAIVEVTFDGPDGEPATDRIRDVHVWKKQADDTWKVVLDVWNSAMP